LEDFHAALAYAADLAHESIWSSGTELAGWKGCSMNQKKKLSFSETVREAINALGRVQDVKETLREFF